VVPFLGPSKLLFALGATCLGSKAPSPSIELYILFETSLFLEQTKVTASVAEKDICDQEFCFVRVPLLRHKSDSDINVPGDYILCYDCRENSLYNFNSASEAKHIFGPASMASATTFELSNETKGECEEE
jgi:hypothetical protein